MSLRRLFLFLVTPVAIAILCLSLFTSWQEPQIQSRLELYQTNILLQAQAWKPEDGDDNFKAAQQAIIGAKPLETATEQYQQVRKSAQANLEKAQTQLTQVRLQPATQPRQQQEQQLQQSINQNQKLVTEIDLRLGLLQAVQGNTDTAFKTWDNLQQLKIAPAPPTIDESLLIEPQSQPLNPELATTASVLSGLWSDPPRIQPDSEQLITDNLEGWFRSQALSRLYQLQQRSEQLATLQATAQATAETAVLNLTIIGTIPAIGGFLGIALLIFLIGQRLIKGKDSLLARNGDIAWETPWDGETILQVFVLGFFLLGQIVVPFTLRYGLTLLNISSRGAGVLAQAVLILVSYIFVATGSLGVMYLSIKNYFPLAPDWFRFRLTEKWWLWGLGGYWVALPLVVIVSLVNQQIWQGQGGSNPLLQLALEAHDSTALGIFFFTAAIAAPLFEEALFRGFLLPSLTRYVPVWGAIALSSLLFALAHNSLAEVLPLTTLGIVLGFVYTRSRNLLAPMLLHSLWNSGTLLSLFVLGSGTN